MEKAIGEEARALEAKLWSGHTATDAEPEPSLSLDELRRVADELLAMGPAPTAVWFVDCPDTYRAFLDRLTEMNPPVAQLPALASDLAAHIPLAVHGIPVVEWQMLYFDPATETIARPDEGPAERAWLVETFGYKRIWPWFVALPGVWVQMSDGSARRSRSYVKDL